MKTIQPVSIMESEWFRYYQLYNSLLKWAEQGLTVKDFKDDMTQFFKNIEPIKKECKYDYLEQRILYATFLEMCDKSLVPDDTQLTELDSNKYVPFETLNDLRDYKIHIGDVIQLRPLDAPDIQHSTIVTNIYFECNSEEIILITLGADTYSLDTLCNNYLIKLDNEWVPFGKRVEE